MKPVLAYCVATTCLVTVFMFHFDTVSPSAFGHFHEAASVELIRVLGTACRVKHCSQFDAKMCLCIKTATAGQFWHIVHCSNVLVLQRSRFWLFFYTFLN